MKKVSVITINYNNAAGLEKTIKSVVGQTIPNFELIIVDGGSEDASLSVIKKSEDNITKWISEKDKGIYHAQNKGILMAKGDYCLFLNAGDVLANENVLKNIDAELTNVDILYGNIITVDQKGIKTHLASPAKFDSYQLMISTLWHPSAFIKRTIFDIFGLYNEDFKLTGDYEFFIRTILKNNVNTRHIPLDIALFDLGGISNTVEMKELQTQERKTSWELNFSDAVIEAFENNTRLLRSREYKLGRIFLKLFKPFVTKK